MLAEAMCSRSAVFFTGLGFMGRKVEISSVPSSSVPRQGLSLPSLGCSGHETRMLEQRLFMGLQL